MDATKFVELIKADSIIQREAICAALDAKGLVFVIVPRDVSRKISDASVDVTLAGMSAMYDGFPIYVQSGDLDLAKQIARDVIRSANLRPSTTGQIQLETDVLAEDETTDQAKTNPWTRAFPVGVTLVVVVILFIEDAGILRSLWFQNLVRKIARFLN